MRGVDIVIIVIALAATAGAYALGAGRNRRDADEAWAEAGTTHERADLLEARVQALSAYRTARKVNDPATLVRELLALRDLARKRLNLIDPPAIQTTGSGLRKPSIQLTPSLVPAPALPTKRHELGEELRVFIKQLERSVGDGPTPFSGLSTDSLRDQLRDNADRLDEVFGAYLAAIG